MTNVSKQMKMAVYFIVIQHYFLTNEKIEFMTCDDKFVDPEKTAIFVWDGLMDRDKSE